MILTIAKREFKTLFLSPLAWTLLAIVQFILAFLFLSQIETFAMLQPQLASIDNGPSLTDIIVPPLFGNAAVILLLITPLMTMRLICEERRNKTLSLLLSAPVSNVEIVFGKYLGLLGLLMLIIALCTFMPLCLLVGGTLDFGKLFANVLALSLLVGAFAAVGLFMSAVTGHPTVAAIGAFGLLLVLWVVNWSMGLEGPRSKVFEYLSILRHFQALQTGLISTVDVLYFLLFITTFLLFRIPSLDNDRLQK